MTRQEPIYDQYNHVQIRAIINGPNAHAKICIETTIDFIMGDVIWKSSAINVIAGDNIDDDIGATKAYNDTKPSKISFYLLANFGSSVSSGPFHVINSGSMVSNSLPC